MLKIGKISLQGPAKIAVPVTDKTPLSSLREASRGKVIAELRIDLCTRQDAAFIKRQISKIRKFPVLATIRSKKEGGGWKLPEKKRLELFAAVLPHVDAIDIELSSNAILRKVVRRAGQSHKTVIISYHNFKGTPSLQSLRRIASRAKSAGAHLVKIAAMANTPEDFRRLADFTISHSAGNAIVIAMGKAGVASRVLFPALGSKLTYAHAGKSTAPGQLSLAETQKLLHLLNGMK